MFLDPNGIKRRYFPLDSSSATFFWIFILMFGTYKLELPKAGENCEKATVSKS